MITNGRARKLFASNLAATIEGAYNILDIGTSCRFAKELRPFESLFRDKEYVAAGYNPALRYGHYNCDCHQDIEALTFQESCFDAVLCIEVLEHVKNPCRAIAEVHRVLRQGGRLFLTVPFLTQYHGKGGDSQAHDEYPDYWRFTHQGLAQLLAPAFHISSFHAVDGPIEFRIRQMRLGKLLENNVLRALVDRVDSPRIGKATSRHMIVAVKQ